MWPLVRFGVIGEAWQLYKRHWVVWSLAMLIVMTCYSLINGVLAAWLHEGPGPGPGGFRLFLPGRGALHFIVSTVVSGFFVGGMIRMASNQVRGRAPRIEDLFSVTDCWFDLLLAALLLGAASALATLLCVIPGFIVFGLFMLAIPLVVEGRLPATGSLIQSWEALKAQWMTATVFHFFLILVASSGILLCCVGVFFTGPLYALSIAILYHEFFPSGPLDVRHKPAEPLAEI
ncbi:MAG: hypothetical protein ACHRXM_03815 [Isosphaerales bacterium]